MCERCLVKEGSLLKGVLECVKWSLVKEGSLNV